MSDSIFSISDSRITIIGLGLMGGSLALSLKDNCRHLSALDPHSPTIKLAIKKEIVHTASSDPNKVLVNSDLVIIACPISSIMEWLGRLQDFITHPCVVIDIGSTKRSIISAMEMLPENFDPIGGHAICGKERLSLKNAEKDLYRGTPFILTPLARTGNKAHSAAIQLVKVIGAEPLWLKAETHDQILAATSHLPYLLSTALVLSTPKETAAYIGPGFRSSARLAGTPSSMMQDVLQTNSDNVLHALKNLRGQLCKIEESLIKNDSAQLKSTLDAAQSHYQNLI